jgi:hypothetical protein
MVDFDLAEMYDVPTKRLNEQVRRNGKRFPADFMFQLTKEEAESLRSQFATSTLMSSHSSTDNAELRRFAVKRSRLLIYAYASHKETHKISRQ